MLTPNFKLEQDDRFLVVRIRAPYTNIRDSEVQYDEKTFLFVSKPYFLRLFLPREVADDESGSCAYDTDTGEFTIRVPKKNKSEYFPNLEMLSELLKPQSQQPSAGRLIEEVLPIDEKDSDGEETIKDEELFSQPTISSFKDELSDDARIAEFGYGFGWQRHNVFARFSDEIYELIDLTDPEGTSIDAREELCRDFDAKKFNADYYLCCLYDPDDLLKDALMWRLSVERDLTLNDTDRERLKNIQIRRLKRLDSTVTRQVAHTAIQILAAYLYELRAASGEPNVESSWTVAKLAPTLAFLTRPADLRQAVVAFVRRSLTYPLFRHWELTMRVLADVKRTVEQGRTAILKCLLAIHQIFASSGSQLRYLFNQLFIEDYILWVQSADDNVFTTELAPLGELIATIDKSWLPHLNLSLTETMARMSTMKLEKKDDQTEADEEEEELDSDDDEVAAKE